MLQSISPRSNGTSKPYKSVEGEVVGSWPTKGACATYELKKKKKKGTVQFNIAIPSLLTRRPALIKREMCPSLTIPPSDKSVYCSKGITVLSWVAYESTNSCFELSCIWKHK